MDRLDVDLYDDELRTEIQLVSDLMVAANESKERLCQPEIDALLGLRRGRFDTDDGLRSGDGSRAVDGSNSVPAVPEQRRALMRADDAQRA